MEKDSKKINKNVEAEAKTEAGNNKSISKILKNISASGKLAGLLKDLKDSREKYSAKI